jgi:acyl-coenzyme A thioesterase PaaI-like protein
MEHESLQERYAPHSVCYGCGPANDDGLKIRSVVEGSSVVATWTPRPFHHAFGDYLNGGIISTILDCHSNLTGAYALMTEAGDQTPPATVTSSISVDFLRPTPMRAVLLEAKATEVSGRRVVVESKLATGGTVTATLRGTFVAVGAGHPAAGRWTGEDARGLRRYRGQLATFERLENLR